MGISRLAVIEEGVHIGRGVTIEPFTVIKANSIIGDGARISSCVRIEEECAVGENTFVGHGVVMRPGTIIHNDCTIGHLTVFEGGCVVNKGTLIHAQCHITRGVVIGENVFIAPMFVGANDKKMCHGRDCLDFEVRGYHIEDGVRIAVGVTMLPDLNIGKNAMIGAGAVVTRDVEENAMVVGVPAKKIGKVGKNERL